MRSITKQIDCRADARNGEITLLHVTHHLLLRADFIGEAIHLLVIA
ncbi:MAG: hypothetical protein LBL65_03810 [Campylobacteraceae bacterium]|jgi:hypothetical protein|nr:hypothetical protein [Campylobacteraceae bacterium]